MARSMYPAACCRTWRHWMAAVRSGRRKKLSGRWASTLGIRSSRPDNDHGTGPDVLWEIEGSTAICMELKTEKQDASQYKKSDTGQLSDHVQWVKENTTAETIEPVFIGPHLAVSNRANPAPEMIVAELSELKKLSERLISAVTDVSSTTIPIMVRSDLAVMFAERDLLFPNVMESIKYKRLADQ